jgi:hypothetical protein
MVDSSSTRYRVARLQPSSFAISTMVCSPSSRSLRACEVTSPDALEPERSAFLTAWQVSLDATLDAAAIPAGAVLARPGRPLPVGGAAHGRPAGRRARPAQRAGLAVQLQRTLAEVDRLYT